MTKPRRTDGAANANPKGSCKFRVWDGSIFDNEGFKGEERLDVTASGGRNPGVVELEN